MINYIRKVISFFLRRKEKIIKFLLSGSTAAIINLISLNVLISFFNFNTSLLENVANFLSMELSILYNFVLSRNWTWKYSVKYSRKKIFPQLISFHLVVGVSIILRSTLFPIFQYFGIHYLLNALIGIALGAVINFVLYEKVVFKNETKVVN